MTRAVFTRGLLRAELVASSWEVFSALLFASAVIPLALGSPWPGLVFVLSLGLSAAFAPHARQRGEVGIALAGVVRLVAWPLSLTTLSTRGDIRFWIATVTFGVMAATMRRAIYRRELQDGPLGDDVSAWLRGRLGESAGMAGILGGHLLLLFGVAFLRAESSVLFRGWWEFLPTAAVASTVAYTAVMYSWTSAVARVLRLSPAVLEEAPEKVHAALPALRRLPRRLSWLNFALWMVCTGVGVFYFQTGTTAFRGTDALVQLMYAGLFSWGVAYYQRGWDRDTIAQVESHLKRAARLTEVATVPAETARAVFSIRERMMRDFGFPLLFAATLMLFSSMSLYRAMGGSDVTRDDRAALLALFAAFFMLVLAVGGVIARVARELARPIGQLSDAAEVAASGDLGRPLPPVEGPGEIARLAVSVERMRLNLSRTIAELEGERQHLEERIEERTAELTKALRELQSAQAALVQGERLASIGELVAGVAHEIHNPLNAVAGSAEPLEQVVADVRRMLDAYRTAERELPAARRADMERLRAELDLEASLDDLVGISAVVKRATTRTVRIVQNLKNFSRSTQEAVPSDLEASLEETLGLLAARLRQSCIQVTRAYAHLPPVVCRGGELNQVFMNLIMNAVQSLESMGEGDDALVKEIRLETRMAGGELAEVVVADTGPGVPNDLKQHIFDPFFTTKPKGQGTGLGLSISTDLVRKHGGTLHVESPPEGGARFVVRIPLTPPIRTRPEPSPSQAKRAPDL